MTFRLAERGILLFSSIDGQEKVQSNKDLFAQSISKVRAKTGELRPLLVSDEGRRLTDTIESGVNEYTRIQTEIPTMCASGKVREAIQMDMEKLVPVGGGIVKAIDELLALQQRFNQEAVERASSTARNTRIAVVCLLSLCVCLAWIGAVVIQQTSRNLKVVAADLAEGAGQINNASSQVASSSQSLAQGSSEQAASLEETSASTEEISSMTRKNAENSQTAAAMMSEVDHHVTEGNRTLEQMVVSMKEITSSSDKISKIIKVIDEIAFQTNILALNAAVEAARAGEAGMGFAVVADEVRNLAQRSAQAAKDTAALIEESIGKSNEGSTKLQQVTEVIRAITESATKVKTLVDEVNLGSQEQARGMDQISKAIAQMDQVTQSTAASAEQSASASEEMTAQSEALKNIVKQLHTMVGGEGVGESAVTA